MKHYKNISVQDISWVKSNRMILEKIKGVDNLYYPEALLELIDLVTELEMRHSPYLIIGHSSNTLFLPSFHIDNIICTLHLRHWEETESHIVCDCGVSVSSLAKKMVKKGYIGFEGLTDLPGTIASAVYGNCGCRGCSINSLVDYFTLLLPSGEIRHLSPSDLHPTYRSTALKRGDVRGVIMQVFLKIERGDRTELEQKAEDHHRTRMREQPPAANNLGTTFVLGQPNLLGRLCCFAMRVIRLWAGSDVASYAWLLRLLGKGRFAPYTWRVERYLFYDAKAHLLFGHYMKFVKRLYPKAQLEIEIRK
jgi:UDP-N-acetylmuramate dehydrogenase